MKKTLATTLMVVSVSGFAYDTTSLVDSNNNNTSTVTSTSTVNTNNTNTNTNTNNNFNVNSGTQTVNNNNNMSGSVTYTNNNINSGEVTYNNKNTSVSTSTNTNNNNNTSSSTSSNVNQNIQSGDMTNRNINDTNVIQKVIQPPPTAMSPTMMSGGNSDLCSTGSSSSVQTQIFGVSSGGTIRDLNCERLKLSKTLYDMGMKVAAVATMCQDRRVFDAMMNAGTPCPFDGKIGVQAKEEWLANPSRIPELEETKVDDNYKKIGLGALLGMLVFKIF